jgi:hypothetical protein
MEERRLGPPRRQQRERHGRDHRPASAAARSAVRCMLLLGLNHMSRRATVTALHFALAKQ